MKDLIDKISSYNLFNYLLPGVLFAVIGTAVSSFRLTFDDIIIGAFVYYFYGMVISRIGSLVLEPLLQKTGLICFSPYADFIAASRIDTKLEILSEQNNTYRTLAATFLCLFLLSVIEWTLNKIPGVSGYVLKVATMLLLALFIFSYRKQTNYIVKRIEKAVRPQPTQGKDNSGGIE